MKVTQTSMSMIGFLMAAFILTAWPQGAFCDEQHPPASDAGTDIVVKFYKVLLQKEEPTREQEMELFIPSSSVRFQLVPGKGEPVDKVWIEPLRRTPQQKAERDALIKRQRKIVNAAGPVVLTYFRKHLEWFLPGKQSDAKCVNLSTTFHWLGGADGRKKPAIDLRLGIVMAMLPFSEAEPNRLRTIIFHMENGKINPDLIFPYGYENASIDLIDKEREVDKGPGGGRK